MEHINSTGLVKLIFLILKSVSLTWTFLCWDILDHGQNLFGWHTVTKTQVIPSGLRIIDWCC